MLLSTLKLSSEYNLTVRTAFKTLTKLSAAIRKETGSNITPSAGERLMANKPLLSVWHTLVKSAVDNCDCLKYVLVGDLTPIRFNFEVLADGDIEFCLEFHDDSEYYTFDTDELLNSILVLTKAIKNGIKRSDVLICLESIKSKNS